MFKFFKQDKFIFGFIMGLIAPVGGFVIYKYTKLSAFTFKETFQYLLVEPGHNLLTVAISLSLMANAVLFTVYINSRIDKTAKGIFIATLIYGLTALSLKTFG
ncbi:MAG: hypothetical protein JST86_03710 [Bacteroidetes bacterium]|nr:hypothetical protein [Bacteroidota bacterium]